MNRINFNLKVAALYIAVALVAGCQVQGFRAREAAGYVTVQAVVDEANQLALAGKIRKGDAVNIETQAQAVKDGLDVAASLSAESPQAGEQKLAATLTILKALQSYLAGVK